VRVRIGAWLRRYLAVRCAFEHSTNPGIREYAGTFPSLSETVIRFHFVEPAQVARIADTLAWNEDSVRGRYPALSPDRCQPGTGSAGIDRSAGAFCT
jgi:hypothetical protein